MELAYWTLEEAKARLGTRSPIPSDERIVELFQEIEARFDAWIGHRIAPTPRTQTLTCTRNGVATLSDYPVLSVDNIDVLDFKAVGRGGTPVLYQNHDGFWRGGQTILSQPYYRLRVTYTAGYDPIPVEVKTALWNIFEKALEKSPEYGSLDFLTETARDLSNVNVGGVSQSFALRTTSVPSNPNGRELMLDRYLAHLQSYKRRNTW